MSIDARVVGIKVSTKPGEEPHALILEDRPAKGGQTAGIAGQQMLYFRELPPWARALVGKDIWGGSDSIMYKEQEIARREGYTRIVFTAKHLHGLGPRAAKSQGQE